MRSSRETARVAGLLFLATFVTAISGLLLYDPVLNDPAYVGGAGADGQVSLGALLEVLLAVANIGTAIVLFPVLRRQSEPAALGYVATRIVESTVIVVGIISLLSIVALRQAFEGTGAAPESLLVAGRSLVALHDATFLMGPGFCVAVGNGLLLGYLMYTSGLVPRGMALLGLVGGPLVFVSSVAVLFGVHEQVSATAFVMTIPEILWEGSLGFYLTFKGFRPAAVLSGRTGELSPLGG